MDALDIKWDYLNTLTAEVRSILGWRRYTILRWFLPECLFQYYNDLPLGEYIESDYLVWRSEQHKLTPKYNSMCSLVTHVKHYIVTMEEEYIIGGYYLCPLCCLRKSLWVWHIIYCSEINLLSSALKKGLVVTYLTFQGKKYEYKIIILRCIQIHTKNYQNEAEEEKK